MYKRQVPNKRGHTDTLTDSKREGERETLFCTADLGLGTRTSPLRLADFISCKLNTADACNNWTTDHPFYRLSLSLSLSLSMLLLWQWAFQVVFCHPLATACVVVERKMKGKNDHILPPNVFYVLSSMATDGSISLIRHPMVHPLATRQPESVTLSASIRIRASTHPSAVVVTSMDFLLMNTSFSSLHSLWCDFIWMVHRTSSYYTQFRFRIQSNGRKPSAYKDWSNKCKDKVTQVNVNYLRMEMEKAHWWEASEAGEGRNKSYTH